MSPSRTTPRRKLQEQSTGMPSPGVPTCRKADPSHELLQAPVLLIFILFVVDASTCILKSGRQCIYKATGGRELKCVQYLCGRSAISYHEFELLLDVASNPSKQNELVSFVYLR